MKQTEGRATFRGHETWYRVTGDLGTGKTPIVLLHGGPGAGHNYIDSYKLLANDGRAVIHYDQLGCGNSTHLPNAPVDFWTPQLFVDELENLIDHLGIRAGFHVLGQSWGGMLGAEYAVRHPKGLKSLTIANSPASMALWTSEAMRQRSEMPQDIQDALTKYEGLCPPCLPRDTQPARGGRQLHPACRRPDGLSHHERAQRILRGGHSQTLGHHARPAQGQRADPSGVRPS